ncbi:MAG: hypothetical protein ACOX6A_04180 [Atribacter sp.]|uniref:hypothetical protein n=1 Tax=Atribacter sp. TaxID=2847780 RepID=UPI003D963088
MEKTIVLCSAWYLSENDFVIFLGEVATLVEQGELNRDIFMWCQNPFESPLACFLDRNYKNPEVQKIVVRTIKIFQDSPERVAAYDSILTGESLKWLEKYEEDMQEGWGFAIRRTLSSTLKSLVTPATSGGGNVSNPKRRFTWPVVIGALLLVAYVGIRFLRSKK